MPESPYERKDGVSVGMKLNYSTFDDDAALILDRREEG